MIMDCIDMCKEMSEHQEMRDAVDFCGSSTAVARSDKKRAKIVPAPSGPGEGNWKGAGVPWLKKQRGSPSPGVATAELVGGAAERRSQDEDGGGKEGEEAKRFLFVADPHSVKCVSCRDYLQPTVHQCSKGHLACDNCKSRYAGKCPYPSCTSSMGQSGCLAIEKILLCLMLTCRNAKHGCRKMLYCRDLKLHEKACEFSPWSCPFLNCSYKCFSKQFSHHFNTDHATSGRKFRFDKLQAFGFCWPFEVYVLEEEKEGALFLLKNETQELGNLMTISCIWVSSKKEHMYELVARNDHQTSLRIMNAKVGHARVDDPDGGTFLLVPKNFFGGCLAYFDIRIWDHVERAKGH